MKGFSRVLSYRARHCNNSISGYGFGSVIWIPTETAFINPGNILPVYVNDSHCGGEKQEENCDKYFVDPTVLNRSDIDC